MSERNHLYQVLRNHILTGIILLNGIGSFGQSGLASEFQKQIISHEKPLVMREATVFLKEKPVTVTSFTCLRSTGGKHDYYSEGTYWWPNPANPNGPYIRRDGLNNPENFTQHEKALRQMAQMVGTLTSAYLLSGEQKYVDAALKHLTAWFVDTSTCMSPHLLYAQAIKGVNTGRGIGIIDAVPLIEVARSVQFLEKSPFASAADIFAVKAWFRQFLTWLNTHPYGVEEKNWENNHGTWWHAQAAAYAALTGDQAMLDSCASRFRYKVLPGQMAPDGSFPLELARTKPYSYTLFNLNGMSCLAAILTEKGINLWDFTTSDGKNLLKGISFMWPYLNDKSKWPFKSDIDHWEEQPGRPPFLMLAALEKNRGDYLGLWQKLDAEFKSEEAKRNGPVKNPILWLTDNQKVTGAVKNSAGQTWQSKFVTMDSSGHLTYIPDKEGNTIPDFSRVGYEQSLVSIPDIPVVETVTPFAGNNLTNIQNAIDRAALRQPDKNGFRGAILLKKGSYEVSGTLKVRVSGIVIRGEGSLEEGTVICETAAVKTDLFVFSGNGNIKREEESKVAITDTTAPAGQKFVHLTDASGFKPGDSVLVYRPATDNWIHDLKMDQIIEREGTKQWSADGYHLYFERMITRIEGNKVWLDYPLVMPLEKKYGGGYLMKYHFAGRIRNVGIENLLLESTFASDSDENHGWTAIVLSKVENGWVRKVTSRYFGQGCVNIEGSSRNITVTDSQCLDPKSQITGGRRYSFNCNGQLNLIRKCFASGGRHDFVTGSRVCGPNVFTRCKARNAFADIGPHHRWSSGTLYDCIDTDGQINVQDRGNWGSGHGWAGVTQVLWSCKSPKTAIQSPWVSGKNYCIGLAGGKYPGRLADRPDGEWEGLNKPGLEPESLYEAQKNQ